MHSAELAIHNYTKKQPKVIITDVADFHTVRFVVDDKLTVCFFIQNRQELINFKNEVLQAFDKYLKIAK